MVQTGGGKADYIPPNEILDKVANALGSTCTGFMVPFGGDGIADGSTIELEVPADEDINENLDDFANVHVQPLDIPTTPNTSGGTLITFDTSFCLHLKNTIKLSGSLN